MLQYVFKRHLSANDLGLRNRKDVRSSPRGGGEQLSAAHLHRMSFCHFLSTTCGAAESKVLSLVLLTTYLCFELRDILPTKPALLPRMVRLLLALGADPCQKTSRGRTPAQLAKDLDRLEGTKGVLAMAGVASGASRQRV